MKQFKYVHQNDGTKGPRLLGQIFFCAGLFVLLVSIFYDMETDPLKIILVGGGAVLIGVILGSIKSRILIDFQTKKFKEYKTILWYKMGEWMDLPKVDQAELVHHSFRTSYLPNGVTPTLNGPITVYKVVLLANGTKFLALDYGREKDAVAAIEEIREGLGI